MSIINYGIAFDSISPTYKRPPQTCGNCGRVFRPDERFVITYDDAISVCICPFCNTVLICEGEPNE